MELDFQEFFGKIISNVKGWFTNLWNRFRSFVLGSAKPITIQGNQAIKFSFPQMNPLAEGFSGNKGVTIANTINNPKWSPQQSTSFSKDVTKNISGSASNLGFKFEIEVALYLIKKYSLQIEGATVQGLVSLKNDIDARLRENWRASSDFALQEMDKYIIGNAAILGDEIYNKTKSLLKCNPTTLVFLGQRVTEDEPTPFEATGREFADIALMCGKNKLGWSIKNVSEPVVTLGKLGIPDSYSILTGQESDEFLDLMDQLSGSDDFVTRITDALYEQVLESGYMTDPDNFCKTLSELLGNKSDTLFGIMNYLRKTHSTGTSGALEKDFNVNVSRRGVTLTPKEGASINVRKLTDGIKFEYRVPGGKGTNLTARFTHHGNRGLGLAFSVNNLNTN